MPKSIFILFFVLSTILSAQNPINTKNIIGQNGLSSGIWVISNKTQNEIKGSTYLFDDWSQNGTIYFEGKAFKINKLNYNIQLERFEAKLSQDSVFAFDRGEVKKIEINNKLFTRYLDPDFKRNTYFENVNSFNDKKLLKKYTVELKEGQLNPMTMQKIQKDIFIKREEYYILKEGEIELSKIKLKRKNILSLIEDPYRSKVVEFAKTNRLSFNNGEDISKILNYYNSMLQ